MENGGGGGMDWLVPLRVNRGTATKYTKYVQLKNVSRFEKYIVFLHRILYWLCCALTFKCLGCLTFSFPVDFGTFRRFYSERERPLSTSSTLQLNGNYSSIEGLVFIICPHFRLRKPSIELDDIFRTKKS